MLFQSLNDDSALPVQPKNFSCLTYKANVHSPCLNTYVCLCHVELSEIVLELLTTWHNLSLLFGVFAFTHWTGKMKCWLTLYIKLLYDMFAWSRKRGMFSLLRKVLLPLQRVLKIKVKDNSLVSFIWMECFSLCYQWCSLYKSLASEITAKHFNHCTCGTN